MQVQIPAKSAWVAETQKVRFATVVTTVVIG